MIYLYDMRMSMLYIIDVIYLLILKSLHILKDKAPKVYVITLGVDFLSWLIKYFYLRCTCLVHLLQ